MRRRRHRRRLALAALAVALAWAVAARAASAPPPTPGASAGQPGVAAFGRTPFGTSWTEVRARYPRAQELAAGQERAAPSIGGPFVRRLLLAAQPVEGFKGTADVELRFWKNRLWTVVVYPGPDPDPPMMTVLGARLGPPTGGDADNPQWTRGGTQTTAAVKLHWYAINDVALSAEAQAWFVKAMRGEWKGPTREELDALADPTPAARQ